MELDWSAYPHLSQHLRELAEHYAKGLGDSALAELLACPAEHQVARLEQFEAFVLAQRGKGAQQQSQELTSVISRTKEQLAAARTENVALARAVESLSSPERAKKKKAVKLDAPKFDGSDGNRLVHWLLAVERSGVAQLIEDDDQMVSYALSNMRGKASEWAYSSLLADADAFPTWAIFQEKIRAMYQPPNNEVLLQGRFFNARQGKRTLHQYVQEMRTLCASITTRPLAESVKVPAFMNGLRQGPARQALFRKMPSTMEEAITIAFVEEQSFNSGMATPWKDVVTRTAQRVPAGPTPMELGAVEAVCFNCGRKGHYKAQCRVKPRPQARHANPRGSGRGWRQSGQRGPGAGRPGNSPAAPQQGNGNAQ
jgi:hypothetical protein